MISNATKNMSLQQVTRVLIVEDDPVSEELLLHALTEFGYEVSTARDGEEALSMLRTGQFRLVVSDWEMPKMSGLELCRQIRSRQWSAYIYVVLLTARSDLPSVVEGLEAGADDFLTKPFRPAELQMRLRVGERMLGLESRDLTIFVLAKLAESRDAETGAHLDRLREYSRILADDLASFPSYQYRIDGDYARLIYLTSPLHDIGKVGIPDSILLKPAKLTPDEFEIMKQHTLIGAATLQAAAAVHPEAQFLAMARDIALSHHERFDGKGYPHGLSGESIPLCGRIVALADVYDALTSKRVYKEAFRHGESRRIILEGEGTQFDPAIVKAFLRCEEQFLTVQQQFESMPGWLGQNAEAGVADASAGQHR